jgi:hypothetical protein
MHPHHYNDVVIGKTLLRLRFKANKLQASKQAKKQTNSLVPLWVTISS